MAFVILSGRDITQGRVHTLSMRGLLMVVGSVAVIALGGGAGCGYYLAQHAGNIAPVARTQVPTPTQSQYLVNQVGSMAGRLYRLEYEADILNKRIGILQDYQYKLQQTDKRGSKRIKQTALKEPAPEEPAGGPFIPVSPPIQVKQLGLAPSLDAMERVLEQVQKSLQQSSQAAAEQNLSYMAFPSRPPIPDASLGSPFGNRIDPIVGGWAFHSGLDFASDSGTPIRAAAGGRVLVAKYNGEMGLMIEIDHGNGLVSRYAHTSKVFVKVGDYVTPGQKIGLVGSTGRSTGPHLHFEILSDRQYVDPKLYLIGLRG